MFFPRRAVEYLRTWHCFTSRLQRERPQTEPSPQLDEKRGFKEEDHTVSVSLYFHVRCIRLTLCKLLSTTTQLACFTHQLVFFFFLKLNPVLRYFLICLFFMFFFSCIPGRSAQKKSNWYFSHRAELINLINHHKLT